MNQLKRKLFDNWTDPWVPIIELTYEDIGQCLQDMKTIGLVVIEENKVRLTQACDVYNIIPATFSEQIDQKKALLNECPQLSRGTSDGERTQFKLGGGESFASVKQEFKHLFTKDTSTWWSPADNSLGGYGTGIRVETKTGDICKLADVDTTHFKAHLKDNNIDYSDAYNNRLVSDIVYDLLKDKAPDFLYENDLKYLVEGDIWGIDDKKYIANYLQLKFPNTFPDNMDNIVWENVKEFEKYSQTAVGLLELIREINFIYHPWVTVREIQEHRDYYRDDIALSDSDSDSDSSDSDSDSDSSDSDSDSNPPSKKQKTMPRLRFM